ncbi:MAG: ClpP family protease [Sediminibacterium sp.]|jgi:ATP-dependent Clp protease protease subunit|nr:ATP-dependent Clp protease proteolytic subunit [Chitinophagaceae bacterium]MCE2972788.1 ATP-dependent Clp protease proteolytic subunit [Sediminibacterium sp.]MCA6484452.1 ATP-dependent Clp protease proteolytic subunit [Chitinophagaceae bacterium]MCA6494910.1 ATP-dependent Clp protease proteolytic subunit [Chitinophagaceae bacterium]MCA6499348.1 ATP-dependent Clp protease proteolytic subunit [Chitinophagaceae bacterium]
MNWSNVDTRWMEDDENENKEEKADQLGAMMMKKMDKLFFERRMVYLWGVVNDKSAREVVTKLMLLDADRPGEEIKFYINSPGGVVTSGMVIHDTMQLIKSPVTTICMGLAASMGSILLSAGTKGKRAIYPHGEVMIHQPSLGGYYQATSADIEIQANQIRKTKELGARILADNCGKTIEQIMKDFDRDYWMNAKEAVNYGIVDTILTKI